ncbi:MAG: RHO1 GDP-GTP exchange protein 2 [Trizodia sp. TS-e1964]|nr:MAG: RHO1 GDP-GTP exchange protein 2 [Trizodia sp. TS-e1964]
MGDYSSQQGRNYRPSNHDPSSFQRDAAFSSIFGAAPPPGRSQTMSSQTSQQPLERAQTMSSQYSTQGAPYTQPPRGPPPPQQRNPPNAYPPRQTSHGYYQAPQQSSGPMQAYAQPPSQQQRHTPQPPSPHHTDRRQAYPQPPRTDSRQPNPQQQYNRAPPSRPQPPPNPAMNSDPYRTRSMATMQETPGYPTSPLYNQAPANAFRQAPYQNSTMARTTAQGRIVPERHDERAMSLTSYGHERDHNHQTMSGRVIPNRRPNSGQQHAPQDPPGFSGSYATPSPTAPVIKARTPSQHSGHSVSLSMSSTIAPSERGDSLKHQQSVLKPPHGASQTSNHRKTPLVYPALLSRVAFAFRERIGVGDRNKNDLTYKNAFTGSEAVDLISYIIKTTDRNLALLLGRALDAQKFFHDVTYDHRLRDTVGEVYQFRETLMEDQTDGTDVNGVFTLLTECYSPTCTRDRLCYSIACPRRLEQQARLNLKLQPGLKRVDSRSSLHDPDTDEQKLWINTVSKEIANSVSEKERKRQEVISEIMYTERDFVKDLEYLHTFWIEPLRNGMGLNPSPIPPSRREDFIRTVFTNVGDIHAVNSRLAARLNARQSENPVVKNVGDIFLEFVPKFEPFIQYGARQLYAKFEFETERAGNPAFSKFVDEVERLKESRKLELNGYLTKPTTRLARYPLLLENVAKYTSDDNPDKADIPTVISLIRDFLTRVNMESGKSENRFNLMQLNKQLKFRPGEYLDLKLTDESRQLLHKAPLKKAVTDVSSEITGYLFDHAVLLVRSKVVNKREELKVYRKVELLQIAQMEEVIPRAGIAKRPSSSLIPGAKATADPASKGYPITFRHLGKGAYEVTLFASTAVQRKKWMENIERQQSALRNLSNFYTRSDICDNFFTPNNSVNCLVPIDGGRKLVYGTDNGIYISDRKPKDPSAVLPKKVIDMPNIAQIDVLEEYQLLLVLSNKNLLSFPMEGLDTSDNVSPLARRPKKIQGHTNFFKAGICLGRHLVCSVKTSALSSTVKVFEPMDSMSKGKKKPAFSKMFQANQDALKPFKEFYIPSESSSIHFLKSKLCVGCVRGFEVVSLESLEAQSLLDQADTSLDFVARKDVVKPIQIERMNGEFLLNYSEFSFFVNRNGWRARPDWKITWEGQPQAFALNYPYILAFEPNFIEIRHIENLSVHILAAKCIRMLHASTREVIYAYENESGRDVIASLDFWNPAPPQVIATEDP